MVVHSATLAVNERLAAMRAAGQQVVHLGFGEAGLPVLPEIAEVLTAHAGRNGYGPVIGSPSARTAAAGYFARRGLKKTDAAQIAFAPGSKPLLYALIAALPGDVVLPQPAWLTYAAQAALAGKHVIGVPAPAAAGGMPDPALLEETLREARKAGRRPGVLLLTLPDNPTGTMADRALVEQVCRIAENHDLAIISDEIYRDLCHRPQEAVSAASYVPDRTFVTNGLSKAMALGGWRIGFARFPVGPHGEDIS
ncbi:pyridoxal phosphate-dependent aminotransferase [Fodinicola feengrottensis]|uniref:pyridoxal phosphate-dependent aminotransferase n=1 Tax=Fodinicola feengrottensis TaxID=435914 RepID=UPI002442C783|nr:aminotransferase class I/II-fold pyridoxal phosphate-dependent enzyme [Fodinicola feengrottensis]